MAKNNNHLTPSQAKPLPTHEIARSLTPATVEQLVENQTKELEIRAQELALQKQQDEHGFEFGKKALEAQLEDRKLHRDFSRLMQRNQNILVTVLSSMVAVVVILALWLNKEAIAMEIIKAIVYIFAGWFGGTGMSKKKAKQQISEENSKTS